MKVSSFFHLEMQHLITNKRKQYGHQHNRQTLWRSILAIPEVDAVVYKPGKQKNTTFNRNLIANIIYIMYRENVIVEHNVTTLTKALEHDKDHSVRSQLGIQPTDSTIAAKVRDLLAV